MMGLTIAHQNLEILRGSEARFFKKNMKFLKIMKFFENHAWRARGLGGDAGEERARARGLVGSDETS